MKSQKILQISILKSLKYKIMKYYLIGAIGGDVIGSRWEWANPGETPENFKLITATSKFTDDTILTMAIVDSLLKDRPYAMSIKKWARRFPKAGYGGMFRKWFLKEGMQPAYNSYANGSAMRILPIPLYFDTLPEVLRHTVLQSSVTHNHTDSLDACMLLAHTIFLARTVKNKAEIYKEISKIYGYTFEKPGNMITRSESLLAKQGVHEALNCFFQGNDYVDVMRLVVKGCGDVDTIGCMAGGLAYVYFEKMPPELIERILLKLPEDMVLLIKKFAEKTENKETKITKTLF